MLYFFIFSQDEHIGTNMHFKNIFKSGSALQRLCNGSLFRDKEQSIFTKVLLLSHGINNLLGHKWPSYISINFISTKLWGSTKRIWCNGARSNALSHSENKIGNVFEKCFCHWNVSHYRLRRIFVHTVADLWSLQSGRTANTERLFARS